MDGAGADVGCAVSNTTYITHVIDEIEKIGLLGPADLCKIDSIPHEIRSYLLRAEVFKLPDDGEAVPFTGCQIELFISKYVKEFKLPFRCCALEFKISNPVHFTKAVVIAVHFNHAENQDRIRIVPIVFSKEHNRWMVTDHFDLRHDGVGVCGKLRNGSENAINAVIGLMAALSCTNVVKEHNQPNVALNKKRESRGKHPFSSYYTLKIKTAFNKNPGTKTGSHASPREHLRRGHIRRLADKTVWVNSCVVGNHELGIIKKDYALVSP